MTMQRPADTTVPEPEAATERPRRIGRPLAHPPEQERAMMMRAAFRALSHESSGTASVSQILAEAQLSTRSFYRHFRSKDELLTAIFHAECEAVGRQLGGLMDRAPTPQAAVEEWIRFCVSLAYDPKRYTRTRVMLRMEFPGYTETFTRTQSDNRAPLVAALEAGLADGSFRDIRPEEDAVLIQDMVNGVLLRRRDGVEDADAEAVTARIFDFLRRGLGTAF